MTHASGIKSSNKLINDIKFAKENKIRCVQIRIDNESLVMKSQDPPSGKFDTDYDICIEKYLKDDECCYILYRTDNTTQLGYEWLFLHWVPDNASIREKMLYASTRSTIKREFGESYFIEDLTGYDKNDLMYSGYLKHIESKNAPPPLTLAEQELIEIRKNERETALGDGHRTLKSNGFPPTDELIKDLNKFANGDIDFLEMAIEIDRETIKPESSKSELHCDQLRTNVNPDKPRYYLYRFRHEFESESYEPLIFIYNMPGFASSVKERMLYSSCKAPFIELLQSEFQLTIQRKLEVISGDFSDLVTDNLLLDIHPPQIDSKPKITKPPGPSNRGPRRLMKN